MKHSALAFAASLLAGVLSVSDMRAQSYGPEDHVLTVGAAEFQAPYISHHFEDDGYIHVGATGDFAALLPLAEGSSIERVCLYAYTAFAGRDVSAGVSAVKLVPGGESPLVTSISPDVHSSGDIGYGDYCSVPFTYTLRGKIDIDNDGTPDAVAYYVIVHPRGDGQGFGGVRITWKRQVSPPPATPNFNDVPSSDPAFQYIEALVASGITAGCSATPPLYCPDANLTRRQMAVFLSKALGLHWTDDTP